MRERADAEKSAFMKHTTLRANGLKQETKLAPLGQGGYTERTERRRQRENALQPAITSSTVSSRLRSMQRILAVVSVLQLACSSDDGSKSDNTSGGMSNTGGMTGSSTTPINGGATNSTSADNGGSSGGGVTHAGTSSPVVTSDVKVAINEVVPSNKTGAIDEAGAYPDWIELYNHGAVEVSLAGFYITDNMDEPTKGALDASLKIPAGGVLLFWADGDVDQGVLHLPFNLAASGEGLFLFDPENKLVDSVEWTTANPDTAYARFPDGTGAWSWCGASTPNKANGSACSN